MISAELRSEEGLTVVPLSELHRTPQLRSGYLDIDRGGGSSYLSPTFWATSGLEMV